MPGRTPVMAKMAVGFALTLIGCGLAMAAVIAVLPAFTLQAVLAFVLTCLFGYFTGALSLINDVRNPKLDWLTETEAIKQKSGALIGMLVSWGILTVLGALSYLLISQGAGLYLYFGTLAAILAVCTLFAHRLLLKTADESYCRNP